MRTVTGNKSEQIQDVTRISGQPDRWAVVLAGGDGTRLRSLTRTITGDERPKQFCPLFGANTLLDQTHNRIAGTVSEEQILVVVTESHELFYSESASTRNRDLLLVQPENKGTAPAIIYALSRIAWEAPDAVVTFFPSDHYFSNDEAFMAQVESAFAAAEMRRESVILLGITPESPEVEYGWIEPRSAIFASCPGALSRVRRFWEKPSANLARELMRRGCFWNSFVMVGAVSAFLTMARRTLPDLCQYFAAIAPAFATSAESSQLRELYSRIPETNFSHEVLAMRPADLAVMKVDGIGWSDLGEPSRVLTTLARSGLQNQWAASA